MQKNSLLIMLCTVFLYACGGSNTTKPSEPSPAKKTISQPNSTVTTPKSGGYYLDDGPGDNPPTDIDSIPNATPKNEPYLDRANKPYKALGATYKPMTTWQPYKERGVASWYGKRYHGRKTSSGEVYDMYSMSAAHTTLPLPSYAKVTNPANGRFVIVRVNDRGPFKSSRIIDLSYAAAYKLRFTSTGSTLVEVEAIDPKNVSSYTQATQTPDSPTQSTAAQSTPAITQPNQTNIQTSSQTNGQVTTTISTTSQAANTTSTTIQYFVQAGAFKNEVNAESLTKKIQTLQIAPNVGINSVYNNGLYRLKLGPYDNKSDADLTAAKIRRELNLSAIIVNQ
ncbi:MULTISPECIES: septal ring lytic transglycosylase RlpA family protein [Methylotenera]|uniref:septal ring lytic transglycosylase RlpA family protein n=1 Tax=Methylotenera TaxID=359407 RepID=UPI000362037F|nr:MULTISPECIES: septal ring lytic transglycosylase RlpA family protein [Methylotenera]